MCAKDCGGTDTVTYQREYECRREVFEDKRIVIPEFTAEAAHAGPTPYVRELVMGEECRRWVSLDPGGTDPTAMLWASHDVETDMLYVEAESLESVPSSATIARYTREHEEELWPKNRGILMRVADNSNVPLLYDLQNLHQVLFQATAKDNKDAAINLLRVKLRDGRLVIAPRCHLLVRTLLTARRASNRRKGFERTKATGHADLLDALLYLVRNVWLGAVVGTAPSQRVTQAEQGVIARPVVNREKRSDDAFVRALGLGKFRGGWG